MAADVPAATVVALAVAVRPEMPEPLMAEAMALASLAIEPSDVVTPPTVTDCAAAVSLAVPIDWFVIVKPWNWPRALVRALAIDDTVIVWPALAPTWNCWALKLPSSRLMPLNWVCVATRSISEASCETSCCSAERSEGRDDGAFELILEIQDVERDAEMRGHTPCVPDIVEGAATPGAMEVCGFFAVERPPLIP